MKGGWVSRGMVLAGALVLLPEAVSGQAICSAPHSSPTLAQSGAIGTLPPGSGWVQVSFLGQRATKSFNPLGERQDFIGGAEFDTRSVYLTGSVGVIRGLELWGQVPLHWLRAEGSASDSRGNGLGDVRAAVRLTPEVIGVALPVALRGGVKLPGSEFPVDATVLPLTEGQLDVEISVESGWASENETVYIVGWLGHRWRARNDDIRYDPGNERFAHLAVGGWRDEVRWELGVDGLWGSDPVEQGVRLTSADRRLIQILPTVGLEVGPGALDLTAPIPVSGKNLPASLGLGIAYRLPWGL